MKRKQTVPLSSPSATAVHLGLAEDTTGHHFLFLVGGRSGIIAGAFVWLPPGWLPDSRLFIFLFQSIISLGPTFCWIPAIFPACPAPGCCSDSMRLIGCFPLTGCCCSTRSPGLMPRSGRFPFWSGARCLTASRSDVAVRLAFGSDAADWVKPPDPMPQSLVAASF